MKKIVKQIAKWYLILDVVGALILLLMRAFKTNTYTVLDFLPIYGAFVVLGAFMLFLLYLIAYIIDKE